MCEHCLPAPDTYGFVDQIDWPCPFAAFGWTSKRRRRYMKLRALKRKLLVGALNTLIKLAVVIQVKVLTQTWKQ